MMNEEMRSEDVASVLLCKKATAWGMFEKLQLYDTDYVWRDSAKHRTQLLYKVACLGPEELKAENVSWYLAPNVDDCKELIHRILPTCEITKRTQSDNHPYVVCHIPDDCGKLIEIERESALHIKEASALLQIALRMYQTYRVKARTTEVYGMNSYRWSTDYTLLYRYSRQCPGEVIVDYYSQKDGRRVLECLDEAQDRLPGAPDIESLPFHRWCVAVKLRFLPLQPDISAFVNVKRCACCNANISTLHKSGLCLCPACYAIYDGLKQKFNSMDAESVRQYIEHMIALEQV